MSAASLIVTPSAPANPVLVRDAGGLPLPPSEIVERCKRIHPSLGLRFASGLAGSGWAITWDWPEHDRRRAWILDGRTDPLMAYDIVGYLPMGCTVDQAPGYIERSLKQYPREEVSRLSARMSHWNNVTVPAEQVKAAIEGTMDDVARAQRAPVNQVISVPSGAVKSKRSDRR